MTVRSVSPVSPYAASVETVHSVGHSDNTSESEDLSTGCLCYSCGNPNAAMDENFLYLFRPREGHPIILCERSTGNVTEHRLQRVNFGNTRYLRQFLKPDLHHRPLKFDLGQLCRDHQRGCCQRGPMCRFIHICRKLPLKAPTPLQQYNNGNYARYSHGTQSAPSPTSSQERTNAAPFVFFTNDAPNAAPQIAFGESTNASTAMPGLLAALQASLIANTISNTTVPNAILALNPTIPVTSYFPFVMNPAAPLFASQLAAQLAAANATMPPFEVPQTVQAAQDTPQIPNTVPPMASSPTTPSPVSTDPVCQASQMTVSSGVPDSIAALWKS